MANRIPTSISLQPPDRRLLERLALTRRTSRSAVVRQLLRAEGAKQAQRQEVKRG